MNVLFLNLYGVNPIAGGISRMTSVLTSALREKGVTVFYLSMIKPEGVKFDNNQFFFPNPQIPLSEDNFEYLKQFVNNENITIVINQATTTSIYTYLTNSVRSMGVKVVSVIHNSILTPIINFSALKEHKLKDLKLSWILPITRSNLFINIIKNIYWLKYHKHFQRLYNVSDVVVLVSKKNIRDFLFMVNEEEVQKVISISNAISLEDYNLDFSHKEKEIIWVGTPDFSIKRVDLALQIWKLLENKAPNWKFTILGDSPSLGNAKELAKSLELKNVFFVGRQNPLEFYKRASFLMMTSTTESFGLVLVEAMHFGVIPIAFNSFPAASDIIENQSNGVLVKPFEIKYFADELLILLNDEKKSRHLALNCIESSKNFDINYIINSWLSLFNKLNDE